MGKKELQEMIKKQDRIIKDLEMKLTNKKENGRHSLKLIRIDHDWNMEDTLFADEVSQYVKFFLFPWYKFLKPGWDEYQPNSYDSLSSLIE